MGVPCLGPREVPPSMTPCQYCGRANDPGAQFCMDCGKPLNKEAAAAMKKAAAGASGGAAAAVPGTQVLSDPAPAPARGGASTPCPFCNEPISANLPYCPHCGRRLSAPGSGPACARCGSPLTVGTKFCATCSAHLGDIATPGLQRPSPPRPVRTEFAFRLVPLDDAGPPRPPFPPTPIATPI